MGDHKHGIFVLFQLLINLFGGDCFSPRCYQRVEMEALSGADINITVSEVSIGADENAVIFVGDIGNAHFHRHRTGSGDNKRQPVASPQHLQAGQ